MELSSKQVTAWQEAQKKKHENTHEHVNIETQRQIKWKPPDSGWHKLNVDASIYEGQSSFKVGMVLRNDKGEFVAGMNKCIAGFATIMKAEAVGVYEALHWIEGFSVHQIAVESDSLNVVNALLRNTIYHSEVGNTLDSCRSILRQRSDLIIQHVRKQANKAAHFMAKLPCLLGTVSSFMSPPSCLLETSLCDSSL